MKRSLTFLLLVMVGTGITFFAGCSSNKDTGTGGGGTPVNIDSSFNDLGELMGMMVDSVFDGGGTPSDFDFSGLNDDFRSYLRDHPDDPTANFGAALTTLLNEGTSDQLDSLVGTLVGGVGGGMGIKVNVPNPGIVASRKAMLSFPVEITTQKLPANFLGQSYLSVMSKALADPPQFSALQNYLKIRFIPALNSAIGFLDVVLEHPDFVFYVTPEMLGGTASDTIEIDHPDFLIFTAGLRGIRSFLHMAVAYNVDIPSYDSTALAFVIDQANDWMSLHDDGATHMAACRTDFMDGVDLLDSALTALEAEQAADLDQSNDLIKANLDPWEYDDGHMSIDSIQAAFTTPQWVTGDFNGDGFDEQVRVDVQQIFDNPLDGGFFNLLPPYSSEVTFGEETWEELCWDNWTQQWYVCYTVYQSNAYLVFTWQANSFAGWTFPNPDLNGILPDITTSDDFKNLLGITDQGWQKTDTIKIELVENWEYYPGPQIGR